MFKWESNLACLCKGFDEQKQAAQILNPSTRMVKNARLSAPWLIKIPVSLEE